MKLVVNSKKKSEAELKLSQRVEGERKIISWNGYEGAKKIKSEYMNFAFAIRQEKTYSELQL